MAMAHSTAVDFPQTGSPIAIVGGTPPIVLYNNEKWKDIATPPMTKRAACLSQKIAPNEPIDLLGYHPHQVHL